MDNPNPDIKWSTLLVISTAAVAFASIFGLQKYVVLGTGRTVTKIVIDRMRYSTEIMRHTRRMTMNLEEGFN